MAGTKREDQDLTGKYVYFKKLGTKARPCDCVTPNKNYKLLHRISGDLYTIQANSAEADDNTEILICLSYCYFIGGRWTVRRGYKGEVKGEKDNG